MSRGVLAVVSGFSGAGKGTIMKSLMAKYAIMHCLYLPPPETPDQGKKTEENTFSAQKKNLRK